MNFYPADMATPPMGLVALLGCPEVHTPVREYLRTKHRPMINAIAISDPFSASRVLGEHYPQPGPQVIYHSQLEMVEIGLLVNSDIPPRFSHYTPFLLLLVLWT